MCNQKPFPVSPSAGALSLFGLCFKLRPTTSGKLPSLVWSVCLCMYKCVPVSLLIDILVHYRCCSSTRERERNVSMLVYVRRACLCKVR